MHLKRTLKRFLERLGCVDLDGVLSQIGGGFRKLSHLLWWVWFVLVIMWVLILLACMLCSGMGLPLTVIFIRRF